MNIEKGTMKMEKLEWEIFKRTGRIEHYLLLKEAEKDVEPNGRDYSKKL